MSGLASAATTIAATHSQITPSSTVGCHDHRPCVRASTHTPTPIASAAMFSTCSDNTTTP
jgi:hypothetical protein